MPTFADATRQVWKQLRPGWRSPQHAQLWLKSLERYAIPRIGEMPISEVSSADVIGILAPIWHDMPPTARKLRQRTRQIARIGNNLNQLARWRILCGIRWRRLTTVGRSSSDGARS